MNSVHAVKHNMTFTTAKMSVFFVLVFHCFRNSVSAVGATETIIRVSNAVTFLQSETVETDVYRPSLDDSGFVNHERRRRMRRDVATPLGDSEIAESLSMHNALRRLEPASDMQYMTWNSYLADMATEYSSYCIWGHGQPQRNASTMPFSPLGQNLYLSTGASINITFLIWRWYSEKPFYNFTTTTCEKDQMCGHYTQVVWSQSREMGCGKFLCPKAVDPKTSETFTNAWIFTCNYGPAGNYNSVKPYAIGEPCTTCVSGQMWCDREQPRGLCRRDCNTASDTCECKASCQNNGVVNKTSNSCRCQCANGWGDGDCTKSCCDYNSYCGNSWPKSACNDKNYGDLIRSFCFKTCGLCTVTASADQDSCPSFTTTNGNTFSNTTSLPFGSSTYVSTSTYSSTTTTPIPTVSLTSSTTTPIPTSSSTTTATTTSTTTPFPTTTSTTTTTPIPITSSTTTSTTTPIPTSSSTTTSTTTPIPTSSSTTTSTTTPISTSSSTTTPVPTTSSTTTSTTTPVPTVPITSSTTTSTTTPIPTVPITSSTTTSTTTPVPTVPITSFTATTTTTPIPTVPITSSTATSLLVQSTTTSTTYFSPVSTWPPMASLSTDASTSNGELTKSTENKMWMIVIVSTIAAVILIVVVIVVILLLLYRRVKKQGEQHNTPTRSEEINGGQSITYASAPPPANPYYVPSEFVALSDIPPKWTEDSA